MSESVEVKGRDAMYAAVKTDFQSAFIVPSSGEPLDF
jgi:hypothetical protein